MGSWQYMKMTRFLFWAIYSQYSPVMNACERSTFIQVKVYERGTFSIKMVYKRVGVGPRDRVGASPYKTL